MQWAQKKHGFTIVELLIVVVVIAILAAITIIAYNGISQRARASAAQSAVQSAAQKLATYAISNSETFPADLASIGLTNSGGTTYQYSVNNSTAPAGYCVTATTSGVSYFLGSNYAYTGSSAGTVNQPSPASGACPGHTTTGAPAISNLSVNPGAESNAAGYDGPHSSAVVRDTTRFRTGGVSMKTTMPADIAGNVGIMLFSIGSLGGANNLQPNTDYVVSAYVYTPTGTVDPYVTVQGAGRASRSDPAGYTTSLKDQWVRIYNSFTTNASGGIVLYVLNKNATTAGMQYWVDDVMISEGTTPATYADGNSSGWVWNGAQYNSTSNGPAL